MRAASLCVLVLFIAGGVAEITRASQPEDKPDLAKEANAAYESKDWQKAVRLYQEIAEKEPQNPRIWYRLATSLHGIGEEAKAVTAYQKSIEAGVPPALGSTKLVSFTRR